MTVENSIINATDNKTSSQSEPFKLLSICMMGRDDDYTHDFIYRITTTLNHTVRNINNFGQMDNVEILITDWGSRTPMSQTLKLSEEATRICRFVYVQPDVIRSTQNGEEYFHNTRAINVAMRRAKGRFILSTNCDQLIQQHSLNTMFSLLDGRIKVPINVNHTFLVLPRLEVPWQFIEHQPDLDEWDRYMLLNEYTLNRTHLEVQNNFGGSGGFLLHRDIFHQLGGFDEIYAGWGWSDNDLGFRASQLFPHLSLSSIGVFAFDMGHKPVGPRQIAMSRANQPIYKPFIEVNSSSWGLVNHEIDIQQSFAVDTSSSGKPPIISEAAVDFRSQSWFTGILQNNDIRQHIQSNAALLAHFNQRITNENIHELLVLSWYSLNYYPRRYVEFGVRNGSNASLVVSACRAVEVYLVDRWDGPKTDLSIQSKPDPVPLASLLYNAGLRGYIRFINGETTNALDRLKGSFIGKLDFDLALVRTEAFGDTVLQQTSDLINYMAPGGALVLTSETESNFKLIWDALQNKITKLSFFLCEDNKTGLVLS